MRYALEPECRADSDRGPAAPALWMPRGMPRFRSEPQNEVAQGPLTQAGLQDSEADGLGVKSDLRVVRDLPSEPEVRVAIH